jgi:hypothetical protein
VNPLLVINCAISLSTCQLPNGPPGVYVGQPVVITFATRQTCEAQNQKSDKDNAAKHLTKVPTHSVCVEVTVDTHGGFDAPDADGGASLWVPVVAVTDAAASAADGPPAGMIAPVVFENNAACLANLPKLVPGKMYPVCAKVEVYGKH